MKQTRLYLLIGLSFASGSTLAFDHPTTDSTAVANESSIITNATGGQAMTALGAGAATAGLAAGDTTSNYNVWGSMTHAETSGHVLQLDYDKDAQTYLVGTDRLLNDNTVLGLSLGFEISDTDENSNPPAGTPAWQDREGFTIAPYLGLTLSENVFIDATLGYSSIDNDWNPGWNLGSTDNFDSERWFAEANINHFSMVGDNVELSVSGGLMWAIEKNDRGGLYGATWLPENTVRVTQLKVGAMLSKTVNTTTPYVGLSYNRDITTGGLTPSGLCTPPTCIDPEKHKQDFQLMTGASWQPGDGMTAGIEGATRFGRDNFDEFVLNANLRVDL